MATTMTETQIGMHQELANPFLYKARVPPSRFIGRRQVVKIILDRLANPSSQGGSAISGMPGIGKTSLLQYLGSSYIYKGWPELAPERVNFVYVPSFFMVPFSVTKFWHYLFANLAQWQANQFKQQVNNLLQILQKGSPPHIHHLIDSLFKLMGQEQLVVVLLDNFDRILKQIQPEAIGAKRNKEQTEYLAFLGTIAALLNLPAPRGFSMIVASEQPLHNLLAGNQFIDFGSALYNNMVSLCLGPFSKVECEELLDMYLEETGINFETHERDALYRNSGGYPAKFQEAAFNLFEEKQMKLGVESQAQQAVRANVEEQQAPPQTSGQRLSSADRDNLINRLSNIPHWKDGGQLERIGILLEAGLPEDHVRCWNLDGVPHGVATRLIHGLEPIGFLANVPEYTALGLLVRYLRQICPDIEAKKFFAEIAVRYQMTTDQTWVDELNQDLKEEA